MSYIATGQVRPLGGRYALLKWSVILHIAFITIIGVSNAIESTGAGAERWAGAPTLIPTLILGVGIGMIVTSILCVVLTSLWTFRALKNLHVIKSPEATMSPGWAVAWYFVPIMNLWKPFQGMEQIWRGSRKSAGLATRPLSFSLPIWWATWIAINVMTLFRPDQTTEYSSGWNCCYVSLNVVSIMVPFWIICAFFLLRITSDVTRYQTHLGDESIHDTTALSPV